jgi:hypothetical protein
MNALDDHLRLCDELHQLALDENRFLRLEQRAPDAALLTRKRALLENLDRSVVALRTQPAGSVRDPAARTRLETTRARILQILQLDRENGELLLRCSLGSGRPASKNAPPTPASLLQKIYARSAN